MAPCVGALVAPHNCEDWRYGAAGRHAQVAYSHLPEKGLANPWLARRSPVARGFVGTQLAPKLLRIPVAPTCLNVDPQMLATPGRRFNRRKLITRRRLYKKRENSSENVCASKKKLEHMRNSVGVLETRRAPAFGTQAPWQHTCAKPRRSMHPTGSEPGASCGVRDPIKKKNIGCRIV